GTDHSFRIQDSFHICLIISRNPVILKVVKTVSEYFPLFQHQSPGQAALHTFQCQVFKHMSVIVHRDPPFCVMICFVERICICPSAISHKTNPPSSNKSISCAVSLL